MATHATDDDWAVPHRLNKLLPGAIRSALPAEAARMLVSIQRGFDAATASTPYDLGTAHRAFAEMVRLRRCLSLRLPLYGGGRPPLCVGRPRSGWESVVLPVNVRFRSGFSACAFLMCLGALHDQRRSRGCVVCGVRARRCSEST